ncbi:TetR/AcrR family transcriptional regulator [Loigolactobacillus coryniformis]|uniref:TetR/AcrR family transcriptional regulator n=1 Tax=Loigolactobacillus coryniformis TaxID=1610 RepID=A0A5B8TG82_9LACO|nr:TetR/AcrR family transcriptional regulator [Loigolactobacillus coryniformis]QEA52828.1 TetR/AcrR family transcriptional regulator [Loigolactobacillus coryniformis]
MGKTRRRGAELEAAIYQATRTIIDREGLAGLTLPKVALAAGTSKPVIYRRWNTPFELAIAAVQDQIRRENKGNMDQYVLTGNSLRADLLQLMHHFLISIDTFGNSYLQSLFTEISQHENEALRKMIDRSSQIDMRAIDGVLKRATDRGENVRTDLADDLKLLPFDWVRYNIFVQKEVTEQRLTMLVDDILLPIYSQK